MTQQAVDIGHYLVRHATSGFQRRWGQQWVIFGDAVSRDGEELLHCDFLLYMTGEDVCYYCREALSLHGATEMKSCQADLKVQQ